MEIKSDFVCEKYVADSFSNPKLHEFLLSRQIDTIEVIGVDGGGCVAMTAIHAIKNGYRVIVADNLSTGHRDAVKDVPLYVGDIRDGAFLDRIFSENSIDGVINFAACSCFSSVLLPSPPASRSSALMS